MAVSRSWTDLKTPCLNRLRVSFAKMRRIRKRSGGPFSRRRSTAFSQELVNIELLAGNQDVLDTH
jgi:hypothetical protein